MHRDERFLSQNSWFFRVGVNFLVNKHAGQQINNNKSHIQYEQHKDILQCSANICCNSLHSQSQWTRCKCAYSSGLNSASLEVICLRSLEKRSRFYRPHSQWIFINGFLVFVRFCLRTICVKDGSPFTQSYMFLKKSVLGR
jgi:hypothetical protein